MIRPRSRPLKVMSLLVAVLEANQGPSFLYAQRPPLNTHFSVIQYEVFPVLTTLGS